VAEFIPISPQEAEQATFTICMRKADLMPLFMVPLHMQAFAEKIYARNLEDRCSMCAEAIVFDPVTAPMQPPRICQVCAAERIGGTVQ